MSIEDYQVQPDDYCSIQIKQSLSSLAKVVDGTFGLINQTRSHFGSSANKMQVKNFQEQTSMSSTSADFNTSEY